MLRIVADIFTQSSAILPITGIVALWSAGKGMQSLINGLNTIYHVHETRGWLVKRIYSVLYTLLFVVALLVSLLALVLGNRIQAAAAGLYSLARKGDRQDYQRKDLPCIFCFADDLYRTLQGASEQEGHHKKPASRSHDHSCGMVFVFLFLFYLFRSFIELYTYLWESGGGFNGHALAVCVHEPSFVRG